MLIELYFDKDKKVFSHKKIMFVICFRIINVFILSGIHKLFHCAPNVPHYAKNKAVGVMKAGHAFTIEPMISEGNLPT